MLAKIYTATLLGLDARIIEVEVDVFRGERKISIVGLPDKAVKESKDRIMSAFKNSGIFLGPGNKIINLAPADLPKSGPSYDLPMAVGLLVASGEIKEFESKGKLFIGEMALDGSVRSVKGILPIIDSIKNQGFNEVFIPEANKKEASYIDSIKIFPVNNIRDLIDHFRGNQIKSISENYNSVQKKEFENDFKNIKGQFKAKRALEIAAAGGHNVLFCGAPGTGKSYMAKALPSILPNMTFEESVEVTRLYSIAGKLDLDSPLVTQRPFRDPHHSASLSAIIGGGTTPRPGEISLAHRGVLFLDEFTEFDPRVVESLRQPIENKSVTISRAMTSTIFPCNFQLIGAMNPCPCGFYGDKDKNCICNEYDRARYRRKVSGPIIDRIDLYLHIPKVKYSLLTDSTQAEDSATIRRRVQMARNRQIKRALTIQNKTVLSNSEIPQHALNKFIEVSEKGKELMAKASRTIGLSARSYFRLLKVARTIADLENSERVSEKHISEALSFRIEFQR